MLIGELGLSPGIICTSFRHSGVAVTFNDPPNPAIPFNDTRSLGGARKHLQAIVSVIGRFVHNNVT